MIKVKLVITSCDHITGQVSVVSSSREQVSLPEVSMDTVEDNPVDIAKNLFKEYSDLSFKFVTVRLLDVLVEDGNLVIYYGVLTPRDTPYKQGSLYTLDTNTNYGLAQLMNRMIEEL